MDLPRLGSYSYETRGRIFSPCLPSLYGNVVYSYTREEDLPPHLIVKDLTNEQQHK